MKILKVKIETLLEPHKESVPEMKFVEVSVMTCKMEKETTIRNKMYMYISM